VGDGLAAVTLLAPRCLSIPPLPGYRLGVMPGASSLLVFGFIVLPALVAAALIAIVWRAIGAAGYPRRQAGALQIGLLVGAVVWMALTLSLAAGGLLRQFDWQPPPMLLLALAVFVLAGWLAFSRIGDAVVRHASWLSLVGLQTFRLPLELLMHRAYVEGVMPVQMSYSGRNFDVITGATAVALAVALATTAVPRWVIAVWNVVGAILLANILAIAIASMPMFQLFGVDRLNLWVADPPFVWLVSVLVLTALAGHLLMFRKLRAV
jgi:hypothetical protein